MSLVLKIVLVVAVGFNLFLNFQQNKMFSELANIDIQQNKVIAKILTSEIRQNALLKILIWRANADLEAFDNARPSLDTEHKH